ncbi:MAG: ArsR family transcriptional regulator [Methanobrevibacter sp.]|uniref:V4R domain-containing protein n=1 Tax=Methanobrevibacter sp. TaxID=66852 RepID=UPI0025CE50C2|nr:V4R domain-containing protein [Methanobrevibacter sp.]MBQ6100040.1 ArsR family transcriptional regulator [Methanobrevibacter sp.]
MTTSNPIQILLNKSKTRKMVNIDIIKSPMKYEILDLLRHNEMNFDEIVENTSKSKAAVSLHLKDLREEGIVKYRPDPTDNRKRIFYLNSEMLGCIDATKVNTSNKTKRLIQNFIEDGEIEYNLMLVHTFKTILNEYGIEINPIMNSIGNHIGDYIFAQVYDEDFDIFTHNILKYWADNNLGFLSFDIKNNLQIIPRQSFESVKLEKTGLPECYLEIGMFESLFSNYFQFNVNITETKCYSMGDDYCLFEVEP